MRNKTTYVNEYAFASISDEAIEDIHKCLDTEGLVFVSGCPTDPAAFLKFMSRFGRPMSKINATGELGAMDYVGDVRYRLDLDPTKRMPTQTDKDVGIHTARSYAKRRPKIFAMLKASDGFEDQPCDGVSNFLIWSEFFEEFLQSNGQRGVADVELMLNTPLRAVLPSYSSFYSSDDLAEEPIFTRGADGKILVRYWVNLVHDALPFITERYVGDEIDAVSSALQRIDEAVNKSKFIIRRQLAVGEIAILNNCTVGHGRGSFKSTRIIEGKEIASPRQIFNAHIL